MLLWSKLFHKIKMPININMHIYYFKAFTQVGPSFHDLENINSIVYQKSGGRCMQKRERELGIWHVKLVYLSKRHVVAFGGKKWQI